MEEPKDKKVLMVIDSNSIIHRAFHALPALTTKKGEEVGAVYGFLLVFFKAIKDFHPECISAAFDLPFPTFRHKKYKEYKAKRPPTPKELKSQMPKVKEILRAFSVPVFEKEGFEADDIIATIASSAKKSAETEAIILSGDLDALQLVDRSTKVFALRKGVKDVVLYDEGLVKERFGGLEPGQLVDFKALRGDSSDNIPGVEGIGDKTATELLLRFGTLENIYKKIKEDSEDEKNIKPRIKETLLKNEKLAFLSENLAQVQKNVPIEFDIEACHWKKFDREKVVKMLEDLEFKSLIERIPDIYEKSSVSGAGASGIGKQGKLL
ncbi:MAG: 5'-3' exonuclease H3TH domain-containing protein [Candidatus Pacebacteria bacterium]|nr:5'-3' exonuclease H3TH domain-containing protein [Candidatus Paceibacterota bacterium]